MKFLSKKLAVFLAFAAVSINSFASSDNCPSKHSMGYCLAEMGEISQGIREATKEELQEVVASMSNKNPTPGVDYGSIAIAGLEFAKVGYTPGLLSSPGWGVFWLVNSLGATRLADNPLMFIILPESEVENGDPRATAEKAWINGVKSFLKATDVNIEEKYFKSRFADATIEQRFNFVGGECGDGGCKAYAKFISHRPAAPNDDYKIKGAKVIDNPPKWIAKEKAYVWNYNIGPWPLISKNDDNPKVNLVTGKNAMEFIKHMPKWFYLYMPGKVQSVINSEQVHLLVK